MSYKNCFVPKCTNSTIKTPSKLFFQVPRGDLRKKWCTIVRRDQLKSLSSAVFCCEDHFDLDNDVENWIRYKVLKDAGLPTFPLKLKPSIVPHKFDCQTDRTLKHSRTVRSVIQKREHSQTLQETFIAQENVEVESGISEDHQMETETSEDHQIESEILEDQNVEMPEIQESQIEVIATQEQACQVELIKPQPPKPKRKSVRCQTVVPYPVLKPKEPKRQTQADISPVKEETESIPDKHDKSFHLSEVDSLSTSSGSTSSGINTALVLKNNLLIMMRKSRYYLGLDPENLLLIDNLVEFGKVDKNMVLLVLRKVRLNEPFHELADIFLSTTSVMSRQFNDALPKIYPLLKTFIFWPSRDSIKKNLPLQFQASFSNVESIIDCFEIQIEKPSKPSLQALTWSDYKSCNTLKYLISVTPAGFINFISQGYGGRTSDMKIVENSGYLEKLNPGAVVLADRGFKQLDTMLQERQCSLKRPPSVSAGTKLTKAQVMETKKIASLRVHVERVIKRLREYKFLDAHSRFHHDLLKNIDALVVVAAGLSNCQRPIINE